MAFPGVLTTPNNGLVNPTLASGSGCHPEAKPKDLARVRSSAGGRDASFLSMTRWHPFTAMSKAKDFGFDRTTRPAAAMLPFGQHDMHGAG
jgi:hypothetical protein